MMKITFTAIVQFQNSTHTAESAINRHHQMLTNGKWEDEISVSPCVVTQVYG